MRRAGLVAVGLLAAAGLAAGLLLARPRWARSFLPAASPRNLLLVSIDTLRADHLGSYGYAAAQTPRLDALARSGLRFATATTVMPLTLPAHSSLMTGAFPAWHGVRDNGGFYLGEDQTTLAEVLRAKGYRRGDDGEMLGEHGDQTHGFFIYDAAVHIPLIVAGPRVPIREINDQVRILDVMPTALELLGVPGPRTVQGVSLLPLARGEHLHLVAHSESWYPRYHYGWSDLQSLQDGRFKYIRAQRPEVF